MNWNWNSSFSNVDMEGRSCRFRRNNLESRGREIMWITRLNWLLQWSRSIGFQPTVQEISPNTLTLKTRTWIIFIHSLQRFRPEFDYLGGHFNHWYLVPSSEVFLQFMLRMWHQGSPDSRIHSMKWGMERKHVGTHHKLIVSSFQKTDKLFWTAAYLRSSHS